MNHEPAALCIIAAEIGRYIICRYIIGGNMAGGDMISRYTAGGNMICIGIAGRYMAEGVCQ